MSAIDVGQIEIVGAEEIAEIYDIDIHVEKNSHASLYIRGNAGEDGLQLVLNPLENRKISLRTREPEGEILFSGFIHKVNIYRTGAAGVVELYGVSASVELDRERKCRSFQNPNITWQEIVRKVLKDTEGAAVIFRMPDEKIERPVIQYEETDWEFIVRIASLGHASVYVDFYSGKPWIYCGLPGGRTVDDVNAMTCSWGKGGGFPFKLVETYSRCKLGERIGEFGNWAVHELDGRLNKGLLEYRYCLRPEKYAQREVAYNRKLKNVCLKGKVLDRKDEQIKIHLDIDEEQKTEQAFWYRWLPESGNMFYCMPEIGASVYLHIEGEDERQAAAVGCVHEDYKGNQDKYYPENRSLVLASQKKVGLLPEMLHITNQKEKRLDINMEDSEGLQMDSFGEINIFAGETIGLEGNRLVFQAEGEISMVRKSQVQPTVINMGNQFDVSGKYAEVAAIGEPMAMMPIIGNGYQEAYSLNQIENAVLSSTPIEGKGMDCEIGKLAVGSKVHRLD